MLCFLISWFVVITYFSLRIYASFFVLDNSAELISNHFVKELTSGQKWTKIGIIIVVLGFITIIATRKCSKKLLGLLSYNPMVLKCSCPFWTWAIVDLEKSTQIAYQEIGD